MRQKWAGERWGTAGLVGLAAAVFASCGSVHAQGNQQTIPDAQVESNVLRALASAPELSTQNVQSTTVYGVVTLTGNVHDETLRTRAENLAARANGVKKVVDELSLGDTPPATAQAQVPVPDEGNMAADTGNDPESAAAPPAGEVLQSDGSYAPSPTEQQSAAQEAPGGQPGYPPQPNGNAQQPPYQGNAENYPQQGGYPQGGSYPGQPAGQPNGYPNQPNGYPNQASGYPQQGGGYPGQAEGYPQNGYPTLPNGYPQRRPLYNGQRYGGEVRGGQVAGRVVTVPAGVPLQIRINQGLRTDHLQPGTTFTGVVLSDVLSDGAVAIPRGAEVHGVVLDAEKAGVLKGRGALALQVTGLELGGQQYPLVSSTWARNGEDKTRHTVNSGLIGGAVGALFGAAIGGGPGAAIGAGVGGAAGVGASAASPNGNVAVPPESVLSFSLAQPLTLTTVGQAELQRLAYAAGPYGSQRPRYYRRPYPAYYSPYGAYYYGR